jgi:hypothetical protein
MLEFLDFLDSPVELLHFSHFHHVSQVQWANRLCLALCCDSLCGDIGFVYPGMSMMVIGPSLLYLYKDSGVCCMMFIDSY